MAAPGNKRDCGTSVLRRLVNINGAAAVAAWVALACLQSVAGAAAEPNSPAETATNREAASATGTGTPATASQDAGAQAGRQCADPAHAIGVSRVVEIDAEEGPQFGLQQYKEHDFLEPGEIVLTFDDGPLRPYTTAILKALDQHCTKATFFNVGKMALADPEMVKEVERRGHTLGSHTWSHRNLRAMAPALAKGEVELGFSAVSRAAGHPVAPFFRFPYLSDSRAMIAHLKSRHLGVFSIDVDAVDYRTRDPQVVHNRILAGLKGQGKGIILFHDIQPSTAGAIKGLLDALKAKGYRVVHLVPKGKLQTLPEYDAIAEQQFTARKRLASSSPLAERSIVWPNTSAGSAADAELTKPHAAARRAAAGTAQAADKSAPTAPATAATVAVVAPPASVTPPAAAALATAPRPRPGEGEQDDWRWKLFNTPN